MKKTDWIILIATAVYTYLFYEQLAGINFIIFNIVLIGGLVIKEPFVLASSRWLLAAFASLFTATCIAIYGNDLSVIANITSVTLLAALSIRQQSSVVIGLINSIYSYITAPVFLVMRISSNSKTGKTKSTFAAKLATIVFPILVLVLFFVIYRQGNPAFKEMTDLIDIDISWPLIRFVLFGLVIISGFYFHQGIHFLEEADNLATSQLYPEQLKDYAETKVGKTIDLPTQLKSGVVLFSLLNVLLLVVNGLDISFLWLGNTATNFDVNYSAAIHQSINTLIFSIVLAIALILFYFRGHINFEKHNGLIKALVFFWIVQNCFLAFSSTYRNLQYVEMHGLTYKRIGVYVYLLLTLSGLLTTYLKVAKSKSNWYLFRTNGWSFFFVLVVSCAINWDTLITKYNLQHKTEIMLDHSYLNHLGFSNIPLLTEIIADSNNLYAKNYYQTRIDKFMRSMEKTGWQSWSIERQRVFEYIIANKLYTDPTINISHD